MKIFKILALASALPVMASLTGCTDDVEYTPAPPVGTPEAYFAYSGTNSYDLDDGQDALPLNIYRAQAGAEQTVNLQISAKIRGNEDFQETPVDFFSIPSTVTFAADQTEVPLTVTFPFDQIKPYAFYEVTVKIDGSFTTPYVLGEETLVLNYIPWQKVVAENGADLIAMTENSMCPYLSGLEPDTIRCPIYEHPRYKGYYRLTNAWSEEYNPQAQEGVGTFLADEGPWQWYIHAEDSTAVYIYLQPTGWDMQKHGLSQTTIVWLGSYAGYVIENNLGGELSLEELINKMKDAGNCGTIDNGNIIIPKGKMVVNLPGFLNGPSYSSNDENWVLRLPGAGPLAVVSDWSEVGYCDYTDGFVGPYFGETGVTQRLMVEQSESNPNNYRVVNPFKKWTGQDSYLEFRTFNEKCVLVPPTSTNYTPNGWDVEMYACNVPGFCFDVLGMGYGDILDFEASDGYDPSTMADGVVTIGANSSCVWKGKPVDGDDPVEKAKECASVLDINTATSEAPQALRRQGPLSSLRLQIPLSNRYILR